MTTAIVAAITSLIISLLSFYQALRTAKLQKEQFEKSQNRNLTSKLYDLRLEHYPRAFEITEQIKKSKGGNLDPTLIFGVLEELQQWKTGAVSMILSGNCMHAYHKFRDALARRPATGDKYSMEQIDKIWKLRSEFRRNLRFDIGLLHIGEQEEKQSKATW